MKRVDVSLDDRGRVPFALVGVLLLVSSTLFASSVGQPARPPEPAVDTAMERTTADARAALRQAAGEAGVEAASNPVVSPADTAYGDVLDEESAFRDALRIRIYLRTRERFESIGRTHRGVSTRVALPEPSSPETLERAKERVSVERAGTEGAGLRVTVRNVSQTAARGDRTVGQRNLSLTVVTHSPVLATHDRVTEFQARLDAGVSKPGLTQKMTARLWGVAWARGYAQYNGAPIENVVANRHLGLLTNGAVLGVQRSVFGESDPDGRRALGKAVAGTVLTKAIGRASGPVGSADELLTERVQAATEPGEQRGIAGLGARTTDTPKPNDTISVAVDESAVRAFEAFAYQRSGDREFSQTPDGSVPPPVQGTEGINGTIQSVYSEQIRFVSAVNQISAGDPDPPDPPTDSEDWVLADEETWTKFRAVDPAESGPSVSTPSGYHTLHKYERTVVFEHTYERTWTLGDQRRTTRETETEKQRVTVAVVGRHDTTDHAPDNGLATVHERGGPFNGTNLADVSDRANDTIVDVNGGPDLLAKDAARGELDTTARTVRAEWPGELPRSAYPELASLRESVREIAVEVERARVGTYEVNPPAKLRDRVQSQRSELIGAPETYDDVAEKARYELRARYVDRVIAALDARATAREERRSGFDDQIQAESDGSLGLLQRSSGARRVDGDRPDSGNLEFTVDGAPPYLAMSEVTHDQVAAVDEGSSVYPLKAENVNVFTIPYGDVTDGAVDWVASELSGSPQTNLHTGASALGSAESAMAASGNESLATDRKKLLDDVNESLDTVSTDIRKTLRRHDVGDSQRDREEIVSSAFERWETPRERALAVSDRSIVPAVVTAAEAHESTNISSEMARDRLRFDLRDTVTRALDAGGVTVDGPVVEAATDEIKRVVGDQMENATEEAVERRFNESINGMFAGLPIAPVTGYWAVTANVWVVNIHGGYERFAVETPRRTPTAADASLSYVRDGANVTLDVDGDGHAELLGHADRVTFELQTATVVVVPPGGTGVGDIDGNLQERSPGWSRLAEDDEASNQTAPGDPSAALEADFEVAVPAGTDLANSRPSPTRSSPTFLGSVGPRVVASSRNGE